MAADGLAKFQARRVSVDRAVRATHANGAIVSRPQIASLRSSVRRQPHAQRSSNRGAALVQRAGRVRHLVGMACEASGIDQWLTPFRSKRRLYSVMRLGREALVRRWLRIQLCRLIGQISQPTPGLLDQLGVPA
jgi:hypothetical protein